MHRFGSLTIALGFGLNGVWMLVSPISWYSAIPGVEETGPFNVHFIRDIGCAFLVSALSFIAVAIARNRMWPAALAGALFLSLHAIVHLTDLLSGREELHHVAGDLALIFLPAALALWLARPAPAETFSAHRPVAVVQAKRKPRGLMARLAEPSFATYEREFGYEMNYLRDVARISTGGLLRFSAFSLFVSHREETPAEAWFTAKITSVMREDCGPCTQLMIDMAQKEGVPAETIRAVVARDAKAMTPAAALAFAFTTAVLDRDVASSDRLRGEVLARWGERALVTLAFAMSSAKVFPTLKYALGHGKSCSRVRVGREEIAVARERSTLHA